MNTKNLYQSGLRVGAVTPTSANWTVVQHHDQAVRVAKQTPFPFVVVAISRGDHSVREEHFDTREAASAAYDLIAGNPGKIAYVAVFDRSDTGGNPFDEGYFVAAADFGVRAETQSIAGWLAAGGAALFGLMAFGGKKGRKL